MNVYTKIALPAALISLALPLATAQQKSSSIPNTGVLPATCPSLTDIEAMLKMAARENIVLKLREHAKATSDRSCAASTKHVETGLSSLLLSTISQDQAKFCAAYATPEVEAAIVTTFRVTFLFGSKPCEAFK